MRAVIAEMPKQWLQERTSSEAAQWDEMWDGELHMPPMPNRMHQHVERDLMTYLMKWWGQPNGNDVTHQVNLTKPEDETHWRNNYRIPDLVLLTPDRFHIDKGEYMAGAPLVCVEIYSPGDESYQKLDFYGDLGVPEVWIIDRNSREVDLFVRRSDATYDAAPVEADGWVRSPGTGIELRPTEEGKLTVRLNGRIETEEVIPVRK